VCHVEKGGIHHRLDESKLCEIEQCPVCDKELFDCGHHRLKVAWTI